MSRGWPAGVILLLLTGTLACNTLGTWPQRAGCPVVPVASGRLSENDFLRAQVRFRFGDEEVGFDVAASPEADGLVVVGLAPYGVRFFTVRQRAREFEVDAGLSRKFRTVALWTMDALHRAYWIEPTAGKPGNSATRSFAWGGEQVLESQRDGRRQRIFVRAGSDFAAPGVTIDYSPDRAPGSVGLVEIRNEWCGYEAVVAVLDR